MLPKRKLGRTGVDVTILTQGTWRSSGGERLLRYSWSNGVRYFDTAQSYGSEPMIARWLKAMPEARKDLFLVTKYHAVSSPRELLKNLDQRLAALQTDYIDLIFLHAVGDHDIKTEVKWPSSREFKETAEAIKKSGKAKFVGFSTHHPRRPEILQEAVKGGFVQRDHAPEQSLECPGRRDESRTRRLLQGGHRADLDEASRRQHQPSGDRPAAP